MELLKVMFAGRTARRIHKTAGALALLVSWSFFGTIHNVMRPGAYATMLFWLALADFAACLVFGGYTLSQPAAAPEKQDAPADKDEMEKAA